MRSLFIICLLLLFSSAPFSNMSRGGPLVLHHDNGSQFVALAPDVIVLDPEAPNVTVNSEVLEFKILVLSRLLPLTTVTLTLNGKVFDKARLENEGEEKRKRFQNVYKLPLREGENTIEITASNIKVSSKPVIRTVTYKPSPGTKPNLVVLSIGVSEYKDIPNRQFSTRDAEAFAKLLNLKGTSQDLYGEVKTQVITDDAANRLGVVKGLGWLNSQVVSDADVRILFLSGAFMDYTTENTYFLSSDYQPETDPEFSSLNLRLIFARLANRRNPIIVFIDTTGASAGGMRAALRQIDDYTSQGNLFVYLCCDSQSPETSSQSAHSPFATTLIEGLNGKADINNDGVIDTSELGKWLMSQLPSLSNGALHPTYLGNQKPVNIFKPAAQP